MDNIVNAVNATELTNLKIVKMGIFVVCILQ